MIFTEYIESWFKEFLEDHLQYDPKYISWLFNEMGYSLANVEQGEDEYLYLLELKGQEIWDKLFSSNPYHKITCDDLPDTLTFVTQLLTDTALEIFNKKKGFTDSFIEDIAYRCDGYDQFIGYFQDLMKGGCLSGVTNMFMFYDETKKFYIEHMDDLEDFVTDLEEELGEPIQQNKQNTLPRYMFVCHLCYEQFASKIACELFSDDF